MYSVCVPNYRDMCVVLPATINTDIVKDLYLLLKSLSVSMHL